MRERSARTSFRCIGRRRSLPRRRRRPECCSSFVHCELAGCDVQARLVSRSCGSFRPTRPAHRRPRHRTCHDGPPLRLPYASTSASPTFADLLLFLNGASLGARRRTQRAVGPGQQAGVVPVAATAGGTSRGRERRCCAGREKGSGAVSPVAIVWPCPLAVDAYAAWSSRSTTRRRRGPRTALLRCRVEARRRGSRTPKATLSALFQPEENQPRRIVARLRCRRRKLWSRLLVRSGIGSCCPPGSCPVTVEAVRDRGI